MALGKRRRQHQDTFRVAADKLGGGPRKVHKRYMSEAVAHNLGRIMRPLIGAGKPMR